MFALISLTLLGSAIEIPSISPDVQCSKDDEVTELDAPESAVEVTRLDADGLDEYILETDAYYGEWPLYTVRFIYRTEDKTLIDTWIMKFDMSETKAAVSVVLDSSVLSDTEFTFVYIEPDMLCPKSARLKFKLPASDLQVE